MSPRAPLSRRQLFALFVSSALSTTAVRRLLAGPLDQGIGGTGAAPSGDETDRGIGGTGVIGTIRKFGSIIVNDLRIAYPPDAEVRIDGQPAAVGDLKIGQVVRVAASGVPGTLSTRTIDVVSEVVGPIERVGAKQVIVLGQTVSIVGLKTHGLKVGETIAISGLRRNDGEIVASLIQPRAGATSRVAGPVRLDADGGIRIGALLLSGADASLVGRRAIVEGAFEGDHLAVAHAVTEASLISPDVRTLSIESYVERRGNTLSLGSGFNVSGEADLPLGRSVRAVLSTSVGGDGGLRLNGLRANGHGTNSDHPGPRGGPDGRGAGRTGGSMDPHGGAHPMDFGPNGSGRGRALPDVGGQAPGPGGFGAGGFPGGGPAAGGPPGPGFGNGPSGGFGGGGAGFGGGSFGGGGIGGGGIGGGRR